jgi:hypothetical protein
MRNKLLIRVREAIMEFVIVLAFMFWFVVLLPVSVLYWFFNDEAFIKSIIVLPLGFVGLALIEKEEGIES